jgi:hypothetical protein
LVLAAVETLMNGMRSTLRTLGTTTTEKDKTHLWYMWAGMILLWVLSCVIRVWNLTTVGVPFEGWALVAEILIWTILFPLAAPAYGTVGVIVLAKQRGNRLGWFCYALSIMLSLQDFIWQYTLHASTMGWSTATPSALLTVWAVAPNFPPVAFTLILLYFPNGQLPSRRWRWATWLAILGAVLLAVTETFNPELHIGLQAPRDNPLGLDALADLIQLLRGVSTLASLSALGIALVSLMVRYWGVKGQQRQQLKWLAFNCAALLVLVVVGTALTPLNSVLDDLLYILALVVGTIGIPIAIAIAILKYRLYDVDLVINRTLVYSLLTVVLLLVYGGSVFVFQSLSRLVVGEQSNLAIVTSTLIIAMLFNPLRHRFQNEIDRRFYRQRYDAAQVLADFSAVSREEVDLQQLTEHLMGVVSETMQPSHISLWLRESEPRSRS